MGAGIAPIERDLLAERGLRSTPKKTVKPDFEEGVAGRGQHQEESRDEECDGPASLVLEDVLLEADDSDAEKEHTAYKIIFHLLGNAGTMPATVFR